MWWSLVAFGKWSLIAHTLLLETICAYDCGRPRQVLLYLDLLLLQGCIHLVGSSFLFVLPSPSSPSCPRTSPTPLTSNATTSPLTTVTTSSPVPSTSFCHNVELKYYQKVKLNYHGNMHNVFSLKTNSTMCVDIFSLLTILFTSLFCLHFSLKKSVIWETMVKVRFCKVSRVHNLHVCNPLLPIWDLYVIFTG